jgi:hypothetical protein
MPKPKSINDATKARRSLRRSGATDAQIVAMEIAILRDVASHSGIGGNSSEYVLERISELERMTG